MLRDFVKNASKASSGQGLERDEGSVVKQFRGLPLAVRGLIVAAVVLGVFFRLADLGGKVYWHDEVFTSIRAVGYVGDDIEPAIFNGQILSADELLTYQRRVPDQGLDDTLYSLTTHPEHPPLYYMLVRLWMGAFGDSVAAVRSLSAVFSLLAFPALYWLCQELFEVPLVGWMAIALFAVSPFHVLYAQEARHYSLWTLMTILSSAALLRALRGNRLGAWGLYALTLTVGFYTSLLSALVAIAHAICVVGSKKCRWTQSLRNFGLAGLVSVVAFAPWIGVLLRNWLLFRNKTGWVAASVPKSFLFKIWGLHLSSDFIDLGLPIDHVYTYGAPALALALVGYALIQLCRDNPRQTWLLVIGLIGLTIMAFIVPDLFLGGRRSSQTRYFVPLLLGAQLAVAYLLTTQLLRSPSTQQWIWRSITGIVITAGVISCAISAQADTWWTKVVSYVNPEIARIVNQADNPLVIGIKGDVALGNIISLSYLVDADVKFQLLNEPTVPTIPDTVGDRFLYFPTQAWVETLIATGQYLVEPVKDKGYPLARLVDVPPS